MDLEKINNLFKPNVQNYYIFFDETEVEPFGKLCVGVLTWQRPQLSSCFRDLELEARHYYKDVIDSSGFLHFSDFVNAGQTGFLKKSFDKIKKYDFVFFFSRPFIGTNSPKINSFVHFFVDFSETKLWGKNITFVYDKEFSDRDISKYYCLILDSYKGHSGGLFCPQGKYLLDQLKESLSSTSTMDVFPVLIAEMKSDHCLQLADFVVGAVRQFLLGNPEYFNLIKDKVVPSKEDVKYSDGLYIKY